MGSSPHVRGARTRLFDSCEETGIIPACAGSTSTVRGWSRLRWDHPRMCGEHGGVFSRGNPRAGSSPHVRGARDVQSVGLARRGIIPACAGSTVPLSPATLAEWGSSPHVRGARPCRWLALGLAGIIPACAGSTMSADLTLKNLRDHPRMCGEHLGAERTLSADTGSSPHVRGAPRNRIIFNSIIGIIPACAGSTQLIRAKCLTRRDHPRMCGEHACSVRRF